MSPPPPPPPAPGAAVAPSPIPPAARRGRSGGSRPHAVVLGWPGQGHINPLLHLSRRLIQEGGYMITFVNTHHNHQRVVRSQQQHHHHHHQKLPTTKMKPLLLPQKEEVDHDHDDDDDDDGHGQDIRFVSIPDGMPDDSDRMAQIPELCRKIEEFMPPHFEKLVDGLMRGPHPVTLILSDVFVLYTQDVANKYSIPRVGFWTQNAASFAIHLYCARGYHAPPEAYEGKRVITDIPGCPPLSQSEMLTFLQPYDPADFMFRFFTDPFLRLDESKAILLNTYEELEAPCIEQLKKDVPGTMIYSSGPVLPEAFFKGKGEMMMQEKINGNGKIGAGGVALWREDYECLKWLDGKGSGSVVYVAFGSITVLRKEVVVEFAHALEESGLAFLWVLRPGMVEGLSSSSDDTSEIMPESWWRRIEGRGKIISWAPQLHVLTHPSVGAFLTHAGWNSTVEGIASGLPMLAFPYFTDQMLNSRCIQDLWRIGLALQPDSHGLVHTHHIRRHLLTVMNDPQIRANSRKLRDAACSAASAGGSSVTNLHRVIAQSLAYDAPLPLQHHLPPTS